MDGRAILALITRCCGEVRKHDLPVHVCAPLGVTGGAESDLVAGIPPPDESHHSLLRRQGEGVIVPFDAISFSIQGPCLWREGTLSVLWGTRLTGS